MGGAYYRKGGNKEWRITAARTLHINEMYHRLSSLEEQVESLTKQLKQ